MSSSLFRAKKLAAVRGGDLLFVSHASGSSDASSPIVGFTSFVQLARMRETNRKIRLITSLGVPCLSHFITPLSLPPTLCSTPDVDLAFLPVARNLEIFWFLTTRALSRPPACFVGFSMVMGTDGGGAAVDELDIPGG
jgi:hypothetical protein